MGVEEATEMIMNGVAASEASHWADLGCGRGTFTHALAALVADGSHIEAIDKTRQSIQSQRPSVTISFRRADMESVVLTPDLDGILMANSLHYVKGKRAFLRRLWDQLASGGKFIVVEYNTMQSNAWVPYPISFPSLKGLCETIGLEEVELIYERPSQFGGTMYAAVIDPSPQ